MMKDEGEVIMMRRRFEDQLNELNRMMIEMGALIENAIQLAINALINKDVALAEKAIHCDFAIDELEKEIESLCLRLLLQQQPVARDLRAISAALKMITDMERIGDHAEDISVITKMLAEQEYTRKLEHIPQMAEATIKMLTDSINAFVKKDHELAKSVMAYDDVVDDLFFTVKKDLINLIKHDAESGEQAIDLLMIAKYFERIGDHAKNIAEWVEFSITGEHKHKKVL
jgi:phosphate transport system protein